MADEKEQLDLKHPDKEEQAPDKSSSKEAPETSAGDAPAEKQQAAGRGPISSADPFLLHTHR